MPRLPREQFEALVRDHHDAVYRAATRVVPDSAMAADVAQDVFVRVLQGKAHLDRADSVRATLCWLATMLANNAWRARRRRDHHEELAMPRENQERNDPAQLCAETDMHQVVREAVDDLPGDLRVPLLLRCQDELSFASIGTAMRISESTAHERVGRALERLRKALSGRGFATAVAGLPQIVASQPSPAVPVGLQARLLGSYAAVPLAAASWGRRAIAAGFGAVALGVIAVVVGPFGRGEPAPVTAVAVPLASAGEAPQDPPPVRTPAPAPAPVPAPAATGAVPMPLVQQDPAPTALHVFTGTVHDSAAWPVAGARVSVLLAGGMKPHAVANATTDALGAFRVEFRMPGYGGRVVRVTVAEDGRELLETADLALPGANAAPLRLVLPAEAGTAAERYSLMVAVCNREGAPLAGVPVVLYAGKDGRPHPGYSQPEVEAASGADGTAVLGGRTQGAKWLFVDGREVGCAVSLTTVATRVGQQQVRIELQPGRTLGGFVTRLDGAPIEWANVWLEDDDSKLQHAGKLETGGAVRFASLGEGSYTLHVYASDCSPARKHGLRAGGPAIDVKLKPKVDPRDVGDHCAELHGRLVDAATGKTVSFGSFDVEVFRRRAGESTLLLDAVEPPRPAQRMDSREKHEQFHEVDLAAGAWILVARVRGYAAAMREFTLGENTILAGVEVPLVRGAEVRGSCVDAAGNAVQGVSVCAIGVGDLADRRLEAWRARAMLRERGEEDVAAPDPSMPLGWGFTREQGTFGLSGVPPGVALRLVAMRKGYELAVLPPRVFQDGEKATDVRLQLTRR
ncbi:MAG TPA: sigma-70 family RNA polymerase sigma factor [Planctomycetota bacterium]